MLSRVRVTFSHLVVQENAKKKKKKKVIATESNFFIPLQVERLISPTYKSESPRIMDFRSF